MIPVNGTSSSPLFTLKDFVGASASKIDPSLTTLTSSVVGFEITAVRKMSSTDETELEEKRVVSSTVRLPGLAKTRAREMRAPAKRLLKGSIVVS